MNREADRDSLGRHEEAQLTAPQYEDRSDADESKYKLSRAAEPKSGSKSEQKPLGMHSPSSTAPAQQGTHSWSYVLFASMKDEIIAKHQRRANITLNRF